MSLISNTRKLMANSTDARVPIEFHFLTHRELYDSSIFSADRRHSDAGRWVLQGDGHWYTINIVTHPVDALPQELCLSFDCFRTIESVSIKLATFTNNNVPAETVANELGCLLSLLVREPLLALGVRRMDGRPVKWDSGYAASWRPPPTDRIPDKGINSVEFRQILHGLAQASAEDANAILSACRLYLAALLLSHRDISTAYFSLVSAIECLAGHYFREKKFEFDDQEKFQKAGATIQEIATAANKHLLDRLKSQLVAEEFFISQKFKDFVAEFLPEEFWEGDELYPPNVLIEKIEKVRLRTFLGAAYNARSKFAHEGQPFPAYVEIGLTDRVGMQTALGAAQVAASEAKFVPLFVWFERLTHYVLQEYLYRVITPDLNKRRAARRDEKNAIFAKIQGLSPSAVQSLKSLTDIIVPLLQLRGFVGPQIPNREWAVDETAIKSLLEADLIAGNGSMDGKSCLKDQWIGEIVGQHFFGENNPFKGNKILAPRH